MVPDYTWNRQCKESSKSRKLIQELCKYIRSNRCAKIMKTNILSLFYGVCSVGFCCRLQMISTTKHNDRYDWDPWDIPYRTILFIRINVTAKNRENWTHKHLVPQVLFAWKQQRRSEIGTCDLQITRPATSRTLNDRAIEPADCWAKKH